MGLEHLVTLDKYVPTILADVKEIQTLVKSEDGLFDILVSLIDKEYARMYIQTSDEIGVERFERIMAITADPSIESLEFRKQRLLTRSNATLPYSTIWLRVYLNSVIGEHNYELNIDYDNDIITLYGYLSDYSWSVEANRTINDIKPCNMIFINVPTMIENVGFLYWLDHNTWQSSTWNDEEVWHDYEYINSSELINYTKQIEASSEFQTLLNVITNVRLNNYYTIQDITKTVKNDTIYIEFSVPEEIKLLEVVEVLDVNSLTLLTKKSFIDTPTGTKIVIRLSCYTRKEQ